MQEEAERAPTTGRARVLAAARGVDIAAVMARLR